MSSSAHHCRIKDRSLNNRQGEEEEEEEETLPSAHPLVDVHEAGELLLLVAAIHLRLTSREVELKLWEELKYASCATA